MGLFLVRIALCHIPLMTFLACQIGQRYCAIRIFTSIIVTAVVKNDG